jgi:hypothetical protein
MKLMTIDKDMETQRNMINYMVVLLSKSGYEDIKADISSCKGKPNRIIWKGTGKGFEPDITAVKNGQLHLFNVETEKTIPLMNRSKRTNLFASFASHNDAVYSILVPTGYQEIASRQLNDLNVFAGVIEIPIQCI